jgi:hypothetical protein
MVADEMYTLSSGKEDALSISWNTIKADTQTIYRIIPPSSNP